MEIKKLKEEAKKELEKAKTLADLNDVYKKYLGRKGEISNIFTSLKDLSDEKKKELGQDLNKLKEELESIFREKTDKIKKEEINKVIKTEKIDITKPGKRPIKGHLHPLTKVQREAEDVFKSMGFSVIEGPEVETSWYNFDALNIPENHPARDMWDTFWLKDGKDLLLRTHTSPVQVRFMENNNPPIRIIVPGRVFRHEATDASHDAQFYQIEGLMVDEQTSASNFKAIIEEFLERFFKGGVDIRLRPSFFPFTEPSFEIDMKRKEDDNWLEIMGAGMVHPNVLDSAGLNSENLQGFAFGVGVDRLAMLKYKVDDVRLFYNGDFKFLEQF